MRPIIGILLLVLTAFAGCTGNADPVPESPDDEFVRESDESDQGTAIEEGEDLGEESSEGSGENSPTFTLPDCGDPLVDQTEETVHPFVINATNSDGVPWKAATLEILVIKSDATTTGLVASTSDIDIAFRDADGTAIARAEEDGPDLSDQVTLTVTDVLPGTYDIVVIGCTTAAGTYTVSTTANMVASKDFSGYPEAYADHGDLETPESSGITVQEFRRPDGSTYWIASRHDSFSADVEANVGAANITVGRGDITIKGTNGDSYSLTATLSANAATEAEARKALARMYVDHDLDNRLAMYLDFETRSSGDGWDDRRVDLSIEFPRSVTWKPLQVTSGEGTVLIDRVYTETTHVETTGGGITLDYVRANDLSVSTTTGTIDADMYIPTAGGDWLLSTDLGDIILRAREHKTTGYDITAQTNNGTAELTFNDVQTVSGGCTGSVCDIHARTHDFADRSRQVTLMAHTDSGNLDLHR